MRTIQKAFALVLSSWLSSLSAVAKAAEPTQEAVVQFQGHAFKLESKTEGELKQLVASDGKQTIAGEESSRKGVFSAWTFRLPGDEDKGFEIILNEELHKVLSMKSELDAGGPFLLEVSPDARWVIFDYGTGTGQRELEVRDSAGKAVFKSEYFDSHDPKWTKDGLEFVVSAGQVPFTESPKAKECEEVGAAFKVEWYRFDGKKKTKLPKEAEIVCGN